jgi:hypothetical protein
VLTEHNCHESETLRKKAVIAAAEEASKILANTRSVARSSYIYPSALGARSSAQGSKSYRECADAVGRQGFRMSARVVGHDFADRSIGASTGIAV